MRFIKAILVVTTLVGPFFAWGQSYTSYFTGNSTDLTTSPFGGVCLMGGATEDDHAMTWFLQQANGGDILVLRASGSDGYNDYLFSQLGVSVNSVETIVFNNASASDDAYVKQKIQQAEAIWFAGGNQWNYVSFWRNTSVDSLINEAISQRNIVIGGTSAGMAILGDVYFSAENGTVTSATSMADPFDGDVTVDSSSFLVAPYLSQTITDTHYDNPDRKGRQMVFMARMLVDYEIQAKGIACDEYTAVCIDQNGLARVYGGFPTYDDNAYFLQTNCELADQTPEVYSPGSPLHWDRGNQAVKVYAVKGVADGANTFDLNDWKTGTGGVWEHWSVNSGALVSQPGSAPECVTTSLNEIREAREIRVYPNPAIEELVIEIDDLPVGQFSATLVNHLGQVVRQISNPSSGYITLSVRDLSPGIYQVRVRDNNFWSQTEKIVVQ